MNVSTRKFVRFSALVVMALTFGDFVLALAAGLFGWSGPIEQYPVWAFPIPVVAGLLGIRLFWSSIDPLCRDDVYHLDKSEEA